MQTSLTDKIIWKRWVSLLVHSQYWMQGAMHSWGWYWGGSRNFGQKNWAKKAWNIHARTNIRRGSGAVLCWSKLLHWKMPPHTPSPWQLHKQGPPFCTLMQACTGVVEGFCNAARCLLHCKIPRASPRQWHDLASLGRALWMGSNK